MKAHLEAILKLFLERPSYLCWTSQEAAHEESGGDPDHPVWKQQNAFCKFFEEQEIGSDGLGSYVGRIVLDYSPWEKGGKPDDVAFADYFRFCHLIRRLWLNEAIELQDMQPGTLPPLPSKSKIKRLWATWEK